MEEEDFLLWMVEHDGQLMVYKSEDGSRVDFTLTADHDCGVLESSVFADLPLSRDDIPLMTVCQMIDQQERTANERST